MKKRNGLINEKGKKNKIRKMKIKRPGLEGNATCHWQLKQTRIRGHCDLSLAKKYINIKKNQHQTSTHKHNINIKDIIYPGLK
jgi:hypothetical protein